MPAIYALCSPDDPLNPLYIGRTKKSVRRRLYQHMAWAFDHEGHPLSKWLTALDSKNQLPVITILEEVDVSALKNRETYWIRFYRPMGYLLNINDGDGPGPNAVVGIVNRQKTIARNKLGWTPQMRKKIVASISKPWSKERKKKWRERPGFENWKSKIISINKTRIKRVVGEDGRSFKSVTEAYKSLGVSSRGFRSCIDNHWRCKGTYWTILDNNKENTCHQ